MARSQDHRDIHTPQFTTGKGWPLQRLLHVIALSFIYISLSPSEEKYITLYESLGKVLLYIHIPAPKLILKSFSRIMYLRKPKYWVYNCCAFSIIVSSSSSSMYLCSSSSMYVCMYVCLHTYVCYGQVITHHSLKWWELHFMRCGWPTTNSAYTTTVYWTLESLKPGHISVSDEHLK